MKSLPLMLDSLGGVGRPLARMDVTPNDLRDEAWLQELLYSHPELLPVDEFGESFSPPIPIGREIRTTRGPIDNLYVSPLGGITVVETKLWKNPEKHRTVVAQIIDYAKELATWDYDRLCEAVLASSRRRGETENVSLEEKVAAGLVSSGTALHEFQEALAGTLSDGNFLLLIVGDRISPNIALLTKAIQSGPGLGFTLALAEMQLYQVVPGKDWPLLVIPEVLGRTVEQTRGVVRVQYVQEKPPVTVTVEPTGGDGGTFIESIPKDLVEPFQVGMEEWRKLGGSVLFTNRMMFFEMVLGGTTQRVVRCRQNQINVIRRRVIEEWGADPALYDVYLEALQTAPRVLSVCHMDRMWIAYETLNASELRTLLRAAGMLMQRIIG